MVALGAEDGSDKGYPDVDAIFALGRADFRSGYPRTWTPHLGELAQDYIAWGIWVSGWDDGYEEHERFMLALHKAIHEL